LGASLVGPPSQLGSVLGALPTGSSAVCCFPTWFEFSY
jgi:hypothetical protein